MPPSTPITCPVIQVELSDNKKLAILPISEGSPTRFRGCLSSIFSFFLSFPNNLLAKGVFTSDGAITFTLNAGAYSAAKDLANPSIAPLAAAILV